jgi:prenyltransferase beta subunit
LKRTHRVDSLGDTNLTYFDEHGQINFDAFSQHISDFLQTVRTVKESLDAHSHTQTIMFRRELIRIMYRLEYDVLNGIEDLRSLQTGKIN